MTRPDSPAGAEAAAVGQGPLQERYARWIERGTWIGLATLMASFAAYLSGLLPARVPAQELAQWWGLPVAAYLERTGAPTGWAWVLALPQGDALALVGIVVLAGCSVPCLLALVPLAWRGGERRLAWLCVAEAVVITLAASGLIAAGH